MRNKFNNSKIKIVLATSIAIFSLFTTFTGTFAWFQASLNRSVGADTFSVTSISSDCGIHKVELIKFEYAIDPITNEPDYLDPDNVNAGVRRYEFDRNNNYFVDSNDDEIDVVMNPYDPVEKIVKGNSFRLIDQNCNAVYALTIKAKTPGTYNMDITSLWLEDKEKTSSQIFLSDCVDFDVYYDPMNVSIGNDGDGKPLYYPTYIDKNTALNSDEELYYRISYLSSQEETHAHFYSNQAEQELENDPNENQNKQKVIPLDSNKRVTFQTVETEVVVYINVNYAPSQMEQYVKKIYEEKIDAVYDFSFNVAFARVDA